MKTDNPDTNRKPAVNGAGLTIIAGPCSAETETQVMDMAAALAAGGKTDLFRAGIWKPRTRPGSFEGIGIKGLKWLQQVKETYGLPCATEVATATHIDEALKHGIDTVWIGARTTTNPFAMQELSAALQGTDVQVMIKNPVNPDADLWTGAVERIMAAGICRISLVHRGFSVYNKQLYKNEPHWDIAQELRNRFPGLPLICDPSHMGGERKYLYEISAKAIEAGYNGLMIETHPDPDKAWSDPRQQITGAGFSELLQQLNIESAAEDCSIPALRHEIDIIDDQLLEIIEHRMAIAGKIGAIKRDKKLAVIQTDRWHQVINRLTHKGREKGLSNTLIEHIFTAIHKESVRKQTKI